MLVNKLQNPEYINYKGESKNMVQAILDKLQKDSTETRIIEGLDSHDILLDIGANIGLYSINYSNSFEKIYAYEPIEHIADLLIKNVDELDLRHKIIVSNSGIGAKTELRKFFINKHNTTNNSIFGVPDGEEITVQFFSISWVINHILNTNKGKNISLIKIDAEGAEMEIIESLEISNNMDKVQNIWVEVHNMDGNGYDQNRNTLINKLQALGFSTEKYGIDGLLAYK